MGSKTIQSIKNAYSILIARDYTNSGVQGGVDGDNMPRQDENSGKGHITDAGIKYEIRRYIELLEKSEIFVGRGKYLNEKARDACKALEKEMPGSDRARKAHEILCKIFYDIRTFGQVFGDDKYTERSIHGPVQFCFANSVDEIEPERLSMTRNCVTSQKEAEDQIKKSGKVTGTFGTRWIIPYGLYVQRCRVIPSIAPTTGFNLDDLKLLIEALLGVTEIGRSSTKGEIRLRGLYIFEHECSADAKFALSYASSDILDSIQYKAKTLPDGVELPRSFDDYELIEGDVSQYDVIKYNMLNKADREKFFSKKVG